MGKTTVSCKVSDASGDGWMSGSSNPLSEYPGWGAKRKSTTAVDNAIGARKIVSLIMDHSQIRHRVEKPLEDERQTHVIPNGHLGTRDKRVG
jgi:hypothetical protein